MSMLHSGGQSKRTLITIDGKTYRSVEELPPELRHRYESAMAMLADTDGNGIPDQLEGGPPDRRLIGHVETSERIFVNGREYGSWKEVPPEVRGMMAGEMPGRPRGISFQLNGGALLVLLLVAAVLGAAIAVVVMS